jgi:hypothetical protein
MAWATPKERRTIWSNTSHPSLDWQHVVQFSPRVFAAGYPPEPLTRAADTAGTRRSEQGRGAGGRESGAGTTGRMVRNRPPVASHAPGDGTRKARLPGRAEKCLPHGRGRPAGVASRRPRRGPDRGGGRAAGRRRLARRHGPAGHRRRAAAPRGGWPRSANQAVNTGRHRQELRVPAQPRHPHGAAGGISPPGGPGTGLRPRPEPPAVPAWAPGDTLSGRRPCGPQVAKAAIADGPLTRARRRPWRPRSTSWSYPSGSRRPGGSRAAGIPPPSPVGTLAP